ncbi:hypothetical protein FC18_GL000977 [Lacticaseibacillus sharpeae JCM 1186 = DSM 20505]|uniref:Uncharacterized protein n=1 Tax=Lacticaseibacillus sharpeae JCM 1186 = DSM 20505 TaxID=1291052 RepID=A0A0R1ZMU8_9LACO|nr:hypothetical protein FC18_GL000977 [Lacticaseibacillus sharpeae JCM 1186 = DSM 20505]
MHTPSQNRSDNAHSQDEPQSPIGFQQSHHSVLRSSKWRVAPKIIIPVSRAGFQPSWH